jgi:hypothetical protein
MNPEIGLVPISRIRVSGLNDEIYHPISPNDPSIRALADSIKKIGLLEPLVLSEDRYILSGHRRFAACRLAGVKKVPCTIRESVFRHDPEFLTILREFNRQRVKGVDEVFRENLMDVSQDDREAAEQLLVDRVKRSDTRVEQMDLRGEKKVRARITDAKAPFLAAILKVISDQKEYWPLTDRQIHYRLLNDPPLIHASKDVVYGNNVKSYKSLCELLTRARLEGHIPWNAIEDPTRPVTKWNVHPNPSPFIQEQQKAFLTGYWRDYLQSQPHHIEIIGEKNTIAGLIRPVAMEFCIPLTIGRGYSSLQPRYDLACRFRETQKAKLVLLMLSDYDPDGEEISHSFARSMRDDFGIANIHPVKVALNRDQVDALALVPVMQAKAGSSNFDRFTQKHGHDVFELEAIPPARLQEMLREVILGVIDVDALNREKEQEVDDQTQLVALKRKMGAA